MTQPQALHEPATELPPQLSELFEEHGSFVRWSLRYLGVRDADLDDTLQEVFLLLLPRRIDPSIAQGFGFVVPAGARRNTPRISSAPAGATEPKNKRAAGQYASGAAAVHQRLNDYERRRHARAWLYSICTRVAHTQRRKNAVAALQPFEAASAPTQFAHVEDREALALVHRLLSQIPAREREVFLLYELEDRSMSQIAQALQCPLQTAYSRLYKARSRILAKLERVAALRSFSEADK